MHACLLLTVHFGTGAGKWVGKGRDREMPPCPHFLKPPLLPVKEKPIFACGQKETTEMIKYACSLAPVCISALLQNLLSLTPLPRHLQDDLLNLYEN